MSGMMFEQHAELTIEAVVIRANGDIEDLGVIASTEDGTATIEGEDSGDSNC